MEEDITPPVLVELFLDDVSVDLGAGQTTFTVRARVTDAGSGLFVFNPNGGTPSQISFYSPSRGQDVTAIFDVQNPLDGNLNDGEFAAVFTLGEFAEQGVWTIERVVLADAADNLTFIGPESLPDLEVAVSNPNADAAPPTLVAIELNDTVIDYESGERTVVVTADFSDDKSGLFTFNPNGGTPTQIQFISPAGKTVTAIFDTANPISGDTVQGRFQATITLGEFADGGMWKVDRLVMVDAASNMRTLTPADSGLLAAVSFEVTGSTSDTEAPKLVSIEASTPIPNGDGSHRIVVTAHLSDDLSGLFDVTGVGGTPPQVQFVNAAGQTATGIFDIANPLSGDRMDGVFQAVVTLGSYAQSGAWTVQSIVLTDAAGNLVALQPGSVPGEFVTSYVIGSGLPDTLGGTDLADAMFGYEGNDVLNGFAGGDTIEGGDGDDEVNGGSGDDTIIGGNGAGNDAYVGGSGIDTVVYRSADRKVVVDLKKGVASGADIGKDKLKQIEAVLGGTGGDSIAGSKGADILDGNTGKDKLQGGKGKDAFVFSTDFSKHNLDKILDFKRADDSFHLYADVSAGLSPGELPSSAFFKGPTAKDADDRLGYDKKKSALLFDADGVGGEGAIIIAKLKGKPAVGADDFIIV